MLETWTSLEFVIVGPGPNGVGPRLNFTSLKNTCCILKLTRFDPSTFGPRKGMVPLIDELTAIVSSIQGSSSTGVLLLFTHSLAQSFCPLTAAKSSL